MACSLCSPSSAPGVQAVEQDAHREVGKEFNLGSPKQLQEILFDQFGLPKTKRIKTGFSTDADSLADLYVKTQHPVLELLLRHREVARLKSVVDGLLPLVDDVGRIHTTFNQTVAATGRLSSTDPNLQNIPVRTAEGRRIRETFVVGAGYESIMTADYSQIEMRIMAHLSHDEGLIEAFTTGEDLHTFVASRAFDLPPEEIDAELRRRVKAMSYGLAYGLSAFGLAKQLKITADEARGQMEAYFTRFGGVRDYLRSVVEDARQTGYTETIMGRRRYLANLTSDNRNLREMAERAALNAPDPGQRGRHHQGGHAGRASRAGRRRPALPPAAAGARRAGARDRAGGARGGRGTRAGRDGRGLRPGCPARRVGGRRSDLARRRALTALFRTCPPYATLWRGVARTTSGWSGQLRRRRSPSRAGSRRATATTDPTPACARAATPARSGRPAAFRRR